MCGPLSLIFVDYHRDTCVRAVLYVEPSRALPEEIWFSIGTTTGASRFYKVALAVAPFQAEP